MKAAISVELLDRMSVYVTEHMGLYFPRERWGDLERGLKQAAPDFGFSDAESCARGLLLAPLTRPQVEILASRLTVGETYFYRDGKMFELLEEDVFPSIIHQRRDAGRSLRIWSAGCATGEEPYSIAILLRRLLHDINEWNITILATDINPFFLRKASLGVYGEWSFRDVPSWLRERYFRKLEKGRYEILPDIKKRVTFSYHNLAEDQYPSLVNNTNAMDMILCRNVLMYFSRDRQREVVGRFYHSLVDGGRLIVSPTEISMSRYAPFVPVQFPSAILYRKGRGATPAPACPPLPVLQPISGEPEFPFPTVPYLVEADGISSAEKPEEPEVSTPQPAALYQEALTAYERGCYADAEEFIGALLARDGDHPPSLALLARVRANAGRLPDARELCERAVAADKLNPGYHYLLATIRTEMDLPEEAEASLKRAVYLDHNLALAHFALGNLARRRGKGRDAARHFENALSAVRNFGRDEILPESEGITAGRMEEIISTTMGEEKAT